MENKVIINSLSEAELYICNDAIIKTDNDILIGKGQIIVTTRQVKLHSNESNSQPFDIILRYQDISFHAIDKANGFILLNLSVDIKSIINNKLYVYSSEVKDIFDQISVGSSLNPDEIQSDDLKINQLDIIKYDNLEEQEENEYMEEDDNKDQNDDIEMNDNEYEKYDFKNSIDAIFKTKKIKNKQIPENDPRRFEDAD